MKISAILFAFAGLAVSVEGAMAAVGAGETAANAERRLDDLGFDELCIICDLCDAFDPACDAALIADFACALCDAITDDEDDGDDPDSDTPCFSELATVQVLQADMMSEASVAMKDLQVGDKISTGMNQYETVYSFGHNNPAKLAEFIQIYNDNSDTPLEITKDHLVFLQGKSTPVAASAIQVGDVLHGMQASKVTKISTVVRKGIYAPLTTGGTLMVDGVLASSYISLGKTETVLSDHDLIHMTLSPYRMVCSGISSSFCNTYNDDGMPHYVAYGLDILYWVQSTHVLVQAVAMAVIVAFTGAFFAWELVFGASLAPLMAFVAVLGYTTYSNNHKSKAKML